MEKIISRLNKYTEIVRGLMTGKVSSNNKNQTAPDKELPLRNNKRNKKIINVIVNTSILLMSTLMGGFTEVMTETMGSVTSGMAEAIGGEEAGKEVDREFKQKTSEIKEKMATLISDIRKDVYAQIKETNKEIEPHLSDPKFDIGPKIIDEYDFKLPKLTEELDDTTISEYMQLLMSENPNFSEMFRKLNEWMNTLPLNSAT